MLGVDALHYYDLYAPLVADVPLEYTVEQARTQIKDAVAILGPDYVQALDRPSAGAGWTCIPRPESAAVPT